MRLEEHGDVAPPLASVDGGFPGFAAAELFGCGFPRRGGARSASEHIKGKEVLEFNVASTVKRSGGDEVCRANSPQTGGENDRLGAKTPRRHHFEKNGGPAGSGTDCRVHDEGAAFLRASSIPWPERVELVTTRHPSSKSRKPTLDWYRTSEE